MAIINQLDRPVNSKPKPPHQVAPPENQEMVVRATKEKSSTRIVAKNNIVGSLIVIVLMIFGIAGGLFLVQREVIFQSKANSGWQISETNINICGDKDCYLPSDLNYCPTASGFELTSENCIGQGAIDIHCSDGMSGYIYHCPIQKEGDCFENKKYIGTYTTGQLVDATAIASQYDCGIARIEFNSNSEVSIPGACGVIILEDTRCTAK